MSNIRTMKLGSLCNILAGGTPSRANPDYWNGEIPWVKISDMLQGHIRSTDETISEVGLDNSAARILPKGTLLVSIFATIGRTAILEIEAATNQAIVGLIPKRNDEVDVGYLRRHLEAQVSSLARQGRGGAQSNINGRILKDLDIPLPPIDEQKRIAAVLGKADTLRQQRQESIHLTERLLQSVFIDMFVRNPQAGNWTPRNVEWMAKDYKGSIRTGPFGSQLLHSEFVDRGIAVLGIDNAVENRFEWGQPRFITPEKYQGLKRYKVLPGDLIITIMGTLGRCAIVPDDIPEAINTKHLCCITLDHEKCIPEFLHAAFLSHPLVLRQLGVRTKGAVMPGLNMGIIKDLELPMPPIELQKKFKRVVDLCTTSRTDLENSQRAAKALFGSLQQRAFRGELDLSRLFLEEDVEDIERTADRLHQFVHKNLPRVFGSKHTKRAFVAPPEIEKSLKALDAAVEKGTLIAWSIDYLKYRIVAAQPTPFKFSDLMRKAESIFEESPPYETIRELIFDLLGQDGKPVVLRQRFDQREEKVFSSKGEETISFVKEMVFEFTP